jgi:hypothetical protein
MKHYVSEFEQWLNQLKQQHPKLEQQQIEGRNLLWDKHPDQVEQASVTVINKQDGYVYYK